MSAFLTTANGRAVSWKEVPFHRFEDFAGAIQEAVAKERRISALFAMARSGRVGPIAVAVLADDRAGQLLIGAADLPAERFPSLTPHCAQAHLFEREIAEQFGIEPEGHPENLPVRFAPRLDGDHAPRTIGVAEFHRVEGESIHEVAVGPVHAGVIEPGHFRFQCHGEHVFELQISLGYQHRGIEESMSGGPDRGALRRIEALAGDTTVGHGLAYCQNLEALGGLRPRPHAHFVRAIALELERLANHTGDLGALAGDVGYLPAASFCGRIRGDFLNLTAELCGSRFGRGLLRPGGIRFAIDGAKATDLAKRLSNARREVTEAVELMFASPSVLARFEGTGAISSEAAELLGLVGPAARAAGLDRDARRDHASGAFRFAQIPVATAVGGDVRARAFVRWLEIQRSIRFLEEALVALPAACAEILDPRPPALRPDHLAASLIEGWRGEICHVASTGEDGRFDRYKVVDPSFHNWPGLALAMRGQQISDFPLCNKSFDLSYCGFDL
ncbi:MAG: NADH-quinone oxidoreductase subunit C [Planctomycetota bacterium]